MILNWGRVWELHAAPVQSRTERERGVFRVRHYTGVCEINTPGYSSKGGAVGGGCRGWG